MDNPPKRIALISEHASPLADLGGVDTGGQNVYVAQLAKHLAHQGHSIDIYTRKENTEAKTVVYWLPNIRIIHVKAGPVSIIPKEDLLQHMREFEQEMRSFIYKHKLQYDLIHANFFMSGLVGLGIKRFLNIPLVITFHALGQVRRKHQQDDDKFPIERLAIEKRICREADQIIAECPQDREDLITLYQADVNKITIVPCGFSEAEFYPINKQVARKMLGIQAHEKVILQLGRMVPRKGIDNVIQALSVLNEDNRPPVRLLIVGGNKDDMNTSDCPEYARLLNLAHALNVSDAVTFSGKKRRDELKFYYAAADVFITTPWYEPFGITPLEAMACGTPVIGSNVGGIKYSVADGITGALVPPNDPQALAAKIDKIIFNERLLSTYRQNSLIRVNAHFTWKRVAAHMNFIYQTLTAHANNPFVYRTAKQDIAAA